MRGSAAVREAVMEAAAAQGEALEGYHLPSPARPSVAMPADTVRARLTPCPARLRASSTPPLGHSLD